MVCTLKADHRRLAALACPRVSWPYRSLDSQAVAGVADEEGYWSQLVASLHRSRGSQAVVCMVVWQQLPLGARPCVPHSSMTVVLVSTYIGDSDLRIESKGISCRTSSSSSRSCCRQSVFALLISV